MSFPVADFLERARVEAERYGLDPWVFVRELLQNARDAGARRVWITAEGEDGVERVSCRDDGEGMTLDHARRYLFTLYASSKRDGAGAAGRFGVGFWSVLRFRPDEIVIRSRPADGEGWEVCLDGELSTVSNSPCVMLPGTEVVLERRGGAGGLEKAVRRAVHDDARFVRCRDDPEEPLEVTVNGLRTAQELDLPAPSVSFRRRGVRGAVALAAEPQVEVFAHGLRVRTASLLDELMLSGPETDAAPVPLPDGLVPRVVVDSDRLRVLLARGDAVEDRALRNVVAVARSELRRLVDAVLDRSAPLGWPGRIAERFNDLWRRSWAARLGAAALIGSVLGIVFAMSVGPSLWPGVGSGTGESRTTSGPGPAPPQAPPVERSYRDLADSYDGPAVDTLDHRWSAALHYRPADQNMLFAALRIDGIDADGSPAMWTEPNLLVPYRGAPCLVGCLDVELDFSAPAGGLRIPIPTGYLLDPDLVRLDGEPAAVARSPAGEPVLLLERSRSGRLTYRCGPGPPPDVPTGAGWPPLSEPLRSEARRIARSPTELRVAEAVEAVRRLIAYDRSAAVADQHTLAIRRGAPFFERALAIGAGDCDVQNTVLAAVLDELGVPARLAVGFVGVKGRVLPGLHAWVEYLEDDRWWVADASAGGSRSPQAPAAAAAGADGPAITASDRNETGPRLAGWAMVLMAGAAVCAVLGGALLVASSRSRRTIRRDADTDLASLIRGVLLRPEAFGDVASVHARRLVPRHGGRAISIGRAQRLARRGRLYRSDRGSELVQRASARGVTVIDSSRDEGSVVADLLAARDLDGWDGVLERAASNLVTERLEHAFRRVGETWRVRSVADAPDAVAFLEGRPLGFETGSGVVVVDEASRLWAAVAAAEDRPDWAAFVLGDAVSRAIDLEPGRRARLLTGLARRAVLEGAA
jgi:hypothetical protein